MPVSTCIDCWVIIPLGESRCSAHKARNRHGRNTTRYRREREQWLLDHPECVDCGQQGDQWIRGVNGELYMNKLTVDHLDPLAKTKGRDTRRWATRCLRCNIQRGIGAE